MGSHLLFHDRVGDHSRYVDSSRPSEHSTDLSLQVTIVSGLIGPTQLLELFSTFSLFLVGVQSKVRFDGGLEITVLIIASPTLKKTLILFEKG